jgi:hypothetical protein
VTIGYVVFVVMILDAGYWMLDAGCWRLDAGDWIFIFIKLLIHD